MELTNQTNSIVHIHDTLGDGFEEHYQPGIKSVSIQPNAVALIADVNAADSTALKTLLTSGKLKITGKDEPAGIFGLPGGNIVVSLRVALAAATDFQIAFGVDVGADLDQVAPDQVFASADDYIVLVVLESALATDVILITKLTTDFTINSANASAAAVFVLRVV